MLQHFVAFSLFGLTFSGSSKEKQHAPVQPTTNPKTAPIKIKDVKQENFWDQFQSDVQGNKDKFAYLIEQQNHSIGAFTTMYAQNRIVVYFDTIDGTSTYGFNPPKVYTTYYMIPAFKMERLTETKESEIVEYNKKVKGENSKKTIYFDPLGRSYKRIILNPIIQKNQDSTCADRTKMALEWMNTHEDGLFKLLKTEMKNISINVEGSDIFGKNRQFGAGMVSAYGEIGSQKSKFDDERKEKIEKLKKLEKKDINVDVNKENAKEQIELFFYLKSYGGPEDAGERGMKFWDGNVWVYTKKLESEQKMKLFPEFFKQTALKRSTIHVIPFPKDFEKLSFAKAGRKHRVSDFTLAGKVEPQQPKLNERRILM